MRKKFPQYLSAPFQVLWFECDEIGIICVFFTIAMIFGSLTWFFLIIGPWYYSHLKKKYPAVFYGIACISWGLSGCTTTPAILRNSSSSDRAGG